jgi:hypothetical protein
MWYYAIIKNSLNVKISGKTERHHIIPKSMGGNNRKDNFVHITLREHFILHKLLTKMTTGKDLSRMWLALRQMTVTRNYKLSSREYVNIRSAYIPHQSMISKEINSRPEYKEKMKTIRSSSEYSEKQTAGKIANWEDPEYRENQKKTRTTPEFRSNLSKIRKDNCNNAEFREWSRSLHTKSWKLWHKDYTNGEWIIIENITKYCLENNLPQGSMCAVARGKLKQCKGWLCVKLDDDGNDIIKPFIPKKRQPHTDEAKKKIGDFQRGQKRSPHSEETRKKLSAAAKKREQRNRELRLNNTSSSGIRADPQNLFPFHDVNH